MPCLCSPSPQSAKYTMVTQDKSPSGVAEVSDEYLFGWARDQESEPSDQGKKEHERKKMDITRPHPDGKTTDSGLQGFPL